MFGGIIKKHTIYSKCALKIDLAAYGMKLFARNVPIYLPTTSSTDTPNIVAAGIPTTYAEHSRIDFTVLLSFILRSITKVLLGEFNCRFQHLNTPNKPLYFYCSINTYKSQVMLRTWDDVWKSLLFTKKIASMGKNSSLL